MEVLIGKMWVRTVPVLPPQAPNLLQLPTWKSTGLILLAAERGWKRVLLYGRCAVGTAMGMAMVERCSCMGYNATCGEKVG